MEKDMTSTKLPKIKISYLTIILLLVSFYGGFGWQMLVIFVSILFHELGHLTFTYLFKGKCSKINLNLFGGRLDIDTSNIKKKWQKILINTGRPYYKFNNCWTL